MDLITIDGSKGEGGGQILRTALALSCILKKPFVIKEIRAKRPKPGLQPQHLTSVNAVSLISSADVTGNGIGSKELSFYPKKIIGGYYEFNIGTAGSISLLAQTLLPVLLYADRQSKVQMTGGTHVAHSPSMDYFENIFLPMIRKFGANAEVVVEELGWYPKGNGKIILYVKPSSLKALEITRKTDLKSIKGIISQSNLPEDIVEREENSIRKVFPGILLSKNIKNSLSPGNSITLWAEYDNTLLGVCNLGEKGLKAEDLASSTAKTLNDLIKGNGCVDPWMGDQILVYMALAEGESKIKVSKITSHMKT
ncbi:MAG: RNA 3'-terminal phosphate cyclase, partial [Candidatus Micrarchaeota archaeon]|nr:RNA 3'-terminal phosphate cyclase [Candidatus Micrarchaeota archaeon]